ncbi:MAG TPA: (Fe-S)-binding protein [Deltaproteobacteria bacterium]|nr:(Fe-S)-binding protein [Deltaproteobacteria bacterium]
MEPALISPATASLFGIPAILFSILIPIVGLGFLVFILRKRLYPLFSAQTDPRTDNVKERLIRTFLYPHHRMPRYLLVSFIHITIMSGFIILTLRWITLPIVGIWDGFVIPGLGGVLGNIYTNVKDLVASLILIMSVFALIRRGVFKPERYAVPSRYGKDRGPETLVVLGLIAGLMILDMLFQGSSVAAQIQKGGQPEMLIPATGIWCAIYLMSDIPLPILQKIHLSAYFIHELFFFSLLCLLPFGRFFHLITALPDLFSMKLNKGTVKPVQWGLSEEEIEGLESFGVKKFQDFTWKHVLDFFSCADCGRCSDQCPANAVGRPLSPRFISIKSRDYCYTAYPITGPSQNGKPLIGNIFEEDEIWSCTTCGACEEECPLLIEYIDKIVDLRRGMVDDGLVPQSLQKPLQALEKRGNPYGMMEKKRADWTQDLPENYEIKILDKKKNNADTLYFVDSITSYDDHIQDIAKSTAKVLNAADIDFGILGPAEKDSGHEVRRFGEEMLFWELRDQNIDAIINSGVQRIVTADPHAYNALKHDYTDIPPVEHISELIDRCIASGKLRLREAEDKEAVYTYHDPCYLGRHNSLYDIPRRVIDAIPGTKRVEMTKCRDRSFCCGGGGLMLYYEPIEEKRMGQIRVEMAKEAGATIIVTACPFCLVNIEDAIKTSGLEGKMEAIDLVQLIEQHLTIDIEQGNQT